MARDILGEYGPEAKTGSGAECGGIEEAKPLPYSPPVGPINQHHEGPGLKGGTNYGNSGTQHKG